MAVDETAQASEAGLTAGDATPEAGTPAPGEADRHRPGGHVADLRALASILVPVLPVAAAVTVTGSPPAAARRRRSLRPSASAFRSSWASCSPSASASAPWAAPWGQQYDGRVLPGVRVGQHQVGGLTPSSRRRRRSRTA